MQFSLYVNGQLNYDEAVRRLEYWATTLVANPAQAHIAIRTLAGVLKRDRDRLYFENQPTS